MLKVHCSLNYHKPPFEGIETFAMKVKIGYEVEIISNSRSKAINATGAGPISEPVGIVCW